jgi:hypothetical protein
MAARHGTFARAFGGCPCRPCQRALDKTKNSIRAESVRDTARHLKLGQAVVTTITGANSQVSYWLDDGTEGVYGDLAPYMVVGISTRNGSDLQISLVMHKALYDAAMDDDEIVSLLQEFVSELAGHVPRSTMRNAIDVSARVDGTAKYDKHLVRRLDMPAILEGLKSLQGMLDAGEDTEKIMRAYGSLRDQVRVRRQEFAQADALFETIQEIMVSRLDA